MRRCSATASCGPRGQGRTLPDWAAEFDAGQGRLPTADHRKRMVALIESLPSA